MYYKLTIFILSIFLLLGCKTEHKTNDYKLKKKIAGSWKKILKRKNSIIYVTTTFYCNGNFNTQAIKKIINKKYKLYSKGKWYIKNGYLIEKVSSSNYTKRGSISKDKIVLINKNQFIYQTSKGKAFSYYRK